MFLLFLACNLTEQSDSINFLPPTSEEHQTPKTLSTPKIKVPQEIKAAPPKPKLPPLLDIIPTRTSIDPYKSWSKAYFERPSISVDAMGSIEHYTEKGYIPYPYNSGKVPRVHKKDRIWLEVSASKDSYFYLIAQKGAFRTTKHQYEKWFQTTMPNTEQLRLFPDGFEITEEQKHLNTIYFVASLEPIEWIETFQMANCETFDPESEICKSLFKLQFEGPSSPKCPNCYPVNKSKFKVGDKELTGAASLNSGKPYAVGIIRFKRPID